MKKSNQIWIHALVLSSFQIDWSISGTHSHYPLVWRNCVQSDTQKDSSRNCSDFQNNPTQTGSDVWGLWKVPQYIRDSQKLTGSVWIHLNRFERGCEFPEYGWSFPTKQKETTSSNMTDFIHTWHCYSWFQKKLEQVYSSTFLFWMYNWSSQRQKLVGQTRVNSVCSIHFMYCRYAVCKSMFTNTVIHPNLYRANTYMHICIHFANKLDLKDRSQLSSINNKAIKTILNRFQYFQAN